MTVEEKVLVIPRHRLNTKILGHGFEACKDELEGILKSPDLFFLERNLDETNPVYKQLIPYVVLFQGNKIFHYLRGKAGSESRLVSKRSLGVGGHISEDDAGFAKNLYEEGFWRELSEEVGLLRGAKLPDPVGFINDDTNEVGKVHIGVVHLLEITCGEIKSFEKQLLDVRLSNINELQMEIHLFETWSQMLVPFLKTYLGS